jgi:hypothetical protein
VPTKILPWRFVKQPPEIAMYTLHPGKKYVATISLGWFESLASNEMVANELRNAGFTDVRVTGSGDTRHAEAHWRLPEVTGPLPTHIKAITELEA